MSKHKFQKAGVGKQMSKHIQKALALQLCPARVMYIMQCLKLGLHPASRKVCNAALLRLPLHIERDGVTA